MSLKDLFDAAVAKLESLHPHLPPEVATDVQQTVSDLKSSAETVADTEIDKGAAFAAGDGVTIAPTLVSTLKELVAKELDMIEKKFALKKTNLTQLKGTLDAAPTAAAGTAAASEEGATT